MVDPNRFPCRQCALGARCDGSTLRTRDGLDARGARWEANSEGFLVLVACPPGHRLISAQERGYENQQCLPCAAGEFIMDSSDPSFRCFKCPFAAFCPGGGPPVFSTPRSGTVSFSLAEGLSQVDLPTAQNQMQTTAFLVLKRWHPVFDSGVYALLRRTCYWHRAYLHCYLCLCARYATPGTDPGYNGGLRLKRRSCCSQRSRPSLTWYKRPSAYAHPTRCPGTEVACWAVPGPCADRARGRVLGVRRGLSASRRSPAGYHAALGARGLGAHLHAALPSRPFTRPFSTKRRGPAAVCHAAGAARPGRNRSA